MKKTFAVIGYGGQGAWHCRQIMQSDTEELLGIWDIDPARREAAAAAGIPVYAGQEALLADARLSCAVIAVPNDSHLPLVLAALQAGKHVICEKPAALSVQDLDRMTETAARCGCLFTVHQNRRWDVDFLAMKGLCESEELGRAIRVESRIHGSRGIPSDWRCTKAAGGGMLYDWGVHLIDQVLQLFPEKIVRVYCEMTDTTGTEVDDGFRLSLSFAGGRTAYLEVGTYHFLAMPRFYLQCENGTAVIEDWRQEAKAAGLKCWNEKDILPVQTAAGITKTMAPRDELTLEYYRIPRPESDVHEFYRNFCAAEEGKEPLLVTQAQVRRVLEVMEAAFLSEQKRQALEVEI